MLDGTNRDPIRTYVFKFYVNANLTTVLIFTMHL